MKITWIVGNRLELAIPLQKMTVTPSGKVTEDYVIPDDAKVRVVLKSGWTSCEYSPSEIVDGNKVVVRDNGTLPVGVYAVHVYVREADSGEFEFRPLHSGYPSVITIRPHNTGVTEEYTDFMDGSVLLDAQTYIFAKGDKGDPGAPGIGVPAGGSTGQVLAKKSDNNYDTEWVNQQGGGDSSQADWVQNDPSAPDYIKNKPSVYTQKQTDEAIEQAKEDVSWEANEYYVLGTGNSATGLVRNPKGRVVYYSSARTAFIRIFSLPHYTSTGISFKVIGTPIEDTDNFVRIVVAGNEIIFRTSNRPTIFKAGVTYEVEYTYITHDNLSCVYLESWSGGTSTAAYTGSYNDLSDKPTIPVVPVNVSDFVNDAGYYVKPVSGVPKSDFSSSVQSSLDKADTAVQTETDPTVPSWAKAATKPSYTAQEVGALPNSTKYGSTIDLAMDSTTYVLTLSLKDQDGTVLNTKTVDLPIESVVVNGRYDATNKKIVLTLQSGSTIDVPVGDLIAGLQTEITSVNMLDADLVDDTNSTHKFVTEQEKTTWNNKSDFSGSYNDLSDKPVIPVIPTNVSAFNNDAGYLTQHQDISGKEDVTTIVTPVNQTDETLPVTALSCEVGKYYRLDVPVETLAVTLPAITDSTTVRTVVLYLTTGTTPAVTISSTAPTGGSAPDVYFSDGFAIEAGKTYEVNCLWNGASWIVASVEIVTNNGE